MPFLKMVGLVPLPILAAFALGGCSNLPQRNPTFDSAVEGHGVKARLADIEVGTLALYGNFCGPSHPRITGATSEEQVRELTAIRPRDDLDGACKMHDICYAQTFFGNWECDQSLIRRAYQIAQVNKEIAIRIDVGPARVRENETCADFAQLVGDYFLRIHPSKRMPSGRKIPMGVGGDSSIEQSRAHGISVGQASRYPFDVAGFTSQVAALMARGGPPTIPCGTPSMVFDRNFGVHIIQIKPVSLESPDGSK